MSDYSAKQSRQNAAYANLYDDWVSSLSPAERARLAALDLDKPDVPRDGGGRMHDAADLPEASYEPDIAADIDPPESPTAPEARGDSGDIRSDTLASFCARIRSIKNPILVFDAVCFATGVLALDGKSQT